MDFTITLRDIFYIILLVIVLIRERKNESSLAELIKRLIELNSKGK